MGRLIERRYAQHLRAQFRVILVSGRPPRSAAEHRAIVETVAARDPDAAETATRDHLAHTIAPRRLQVAARWSVETSAAG